MSGVLKLGGVTVATETGGAVSLDSNISMSANHAGVKSALNASGDAPIYACRAWVNFQGTSGTTADYKTISNSGNVSSVYEDSLGNYTINFATAMPDANYSVAGAVNQSQSTAVADFSLQGTQSTTSVQVGSHVTSTYSRVDSAIVCVSIFC